MGRKETSRLGVGWSAWLGLIDGRVKANAASLCGLKILVRCSYENWRATNVLRKAGRENCNVSAEVERDRPAGRRARSRAIDALNPIAAGTRHIEVEPIWVENERRWRNPVATLLRGRVEADPLEDVVNVEA